MRSAVAVADVSPRMAAGAVSLASTRRAVRGAAERCRCRRCCRRGRMSIGGRRRGVVVVAARRRHGDERSLPTTHASLGGTVTASHPDQTLLHDVDDESPVGGEDRSARQGRAPTSSRTPSARTAATRRLGTGGGTTSRGRGSPSSACRSSDDMPNGRSVGVEQRHVAGVGDDAGVQHRIVGQAAVGAHPHQLTVDLSSASSSGSGGTYRMSIGRGCVVPGADLVAIAAPGARASRGAIRAAARRAVPASRDRGQAPAGGSSPAG